MMTHQTYLDTQSKFDVVSCLDSPHEHCKWETAVNTETTLRSNQSWLSDFTSIATLINPRHTGNKRGLKMIRMEPQSVVIICRTQKSSKETNDLKNQ